MEMDLRHAYEYTMFPFVFNELIKYRVINLWRDAALKVGNAKDDW
jgi:hypothetical protein